MMSLVMVKGDLVLLLGRGTIGCHVTGAMAHGEVTRDPVGGVRPTKLILMNKLREKDCQMMESVLGSLSI